MSQSSTSSQELYRLRRNLILSKIYENINEALAEGSKLELAEENVQLLPDYLQIMGVSDLQDLLILGGSFLK